MAYNQTFDTIVYSENGSDPNEIHLLNSTLNYRSLPNLDLFHDYKELVNLTELNLTSCLWPNYYPDIYSWNPNLPVFKLNKSYSIKVGRNVTDNYEIIPFDHCQKSRFLIRVWSNDPQIENIWDKLLWIDVNQSNSTIQIKPQNVQSVGTFNIWIQAQLVVGLINTFILPNYMITESVIIELINTNCQLYSNFSNLFIIVNKIKTLDINFFDEENDKITFNVIDSGGIGAFIKSINASSFTIYLNWIDDFPKQVQLSFRYTDEYHLNNAEWQMFFLDLNIFLSEPPIFKNDIKPITVNKWFSDIFSQILPEIVDPDSNLFSITFLENVPSWIYINSINASNYPSYALFINWINNNCDSGSDILHLTLILSDDSGAFTKYPIEIVFKSDLDISFGFINNFDIKVSQSIRIPLNIGNVNFQAKTWGKYDNINWIWYSQKDKFVYIFDQAKWEFYYGKTIIVNNL